MRVVFAGDRAVAVEALKHLLSSEAEVVGLLTSHPSRASHAGELRRMCSHLPGENHWEGKTFRTDRGREWLTALAPDLVVGVHFPYLIPNSILGLPRLGVSNLHPAYLPYNRGWHTPSWAILDGTPTGGTLHWMSEGIDEGPIIARQACATYPWDTADSLYARVLETETQLFARALPALLGGDPGRPQTLAGTRHVAGDLGSVRSLDPQRRMSLESLLRRLRALTTNRLEEAAHLAGDDAPLRVALEPLPPEGENGSPVSLETVGSVAEHLRRIRDGCVVAGASFTMRVSFL